MSETVENSSLVPGSEPLANAKWELYARERALCCSRMVAYRNAGFESEDDHAARGNAGKLERKRAITDRIAWLCRQDEDVLRAKRQRIEEFKWSVKNADIGSYYVMVELPILNKEGNPVLDDEGKQCVRIVQNLKPFSDMTAEQRSIIQSLKYTDSGRPSLEFYSKQWAVTELGKMLGSNTPTIGDEFADMSLDELKEVAAREAIALGLTELVKRTNAGRGEQAKV